jgi:hypothetical protein
MPAEDETFEVTVSDTKSLAPNCWLWNESVGYLEVVNYSLYNSTITVKNLGRRENAKRGTEFPTCMEFLVTAPTALDPYNPLSTCLAADFNSPAVGQTALMSVSSTYVIKPDDQIIVDGDYRYAVVQVINSTTLKVLNEGLGKEGIIEAGCDSCVPVQVVSKLNCCPVPSGDLTSNTPVLSVTDGYDVLLDNASLTLDIDLSKYDNSSSEFITLNDVPRGTLSSSSTLIGVTGGANNVLGNISLSLDTDLSKYNNSNSSFITVGDIPRGELYSSTNVLTVNNGANNVLSNIELILDKDLSKYNNTTSAFITLGDIPRGTLSSSTSLLTVSGGTNNVLDNISLTLDTDLNNYDNTNSSFLSSSDKKNLTSTTSVLTVNNGTGAVLESTALTLNTDLSQYDNSVSNFVTAGGLPSGDLSSVTSVLTVSGGNGAVLTNSTLTLDTDLSQYDNTTSAFITLSDIPALPSDTDLSHYDNTTSGFITSISNLDDIGDVTITSPQNGDVLTYDSNSGEWINSAGGGGGSYLPLAGGQMTGNITVSGTHVLGSASQAWSTVYTGSVKDNSNTLYVGGNDSSVFYLVPTATATTNNLGSANKQWTTLYASSVETTGTTLSVGGADASNFYLVPTATAVNNHIGRYASPWENSYVTDSYVDTIYSLNTAVTISANVIPGANTDTIGTSSAPWGAGYFNGATISSTGINPTTYPEYLGDASNIWYSIHTYNVKSTARVTLTSYDGQASQCSISLRGSTLCPDTSPSTTPVSLGYYDSNNDFRWYRLCIDNIYFHPGGAITHTYNGTTTTVITITANGRAYTFGSGSAGPVAGSDKLLKKNIITMPDGALDIIKELRPVKFDFKLDERDDSYNAGFIAQETDNILPNLTVPPATEDGVYGIDYAGFVPYLVKAVQELSSKVDELNAKIKAAGI